MVQKRNHRVQAARTSARLGGLEVPVVNLSLGGACLALSEGLDAEAPFTLELEHPHFTGSAALRAEVVWSRPATPASVHSNVAAHAGIRFLGLNAVERTQLRRCMLAEYGHAVWTGDGTGRPIGYVVPVNATSWGMFDHSIRQVGTLRRDGARLLVATETRPETEVPTFAEAAARAFGLPRPPRLDPPLDRIADLILEPKPLPNLSGSLVLDDCRPIGYVARVGESWSFFDTQREPLGFMTLAPSGEWRVVVLGTNEDESLDLRRANSYPEALAAAYSLENPPMLRSTVFTPRRLLDE